MEQRSKSEWGETHWYEIRTEDLRRFNEVDTASADCKRRKDELDDLTADALERAKKELIRDQQVVGRCAACQIGRIQSHRCGRVEGAGCGNRQSQHLKQHCILCRKTRASYRGWKV